MIILLLFRQRVFWTKFSDLPEMMGSSAGNPIDGLVKAQKKKHDFPKIFALSNPFNSPLLTPCLMLKSCEKKMKTHQIFLAGFTKISRTRAPGRTGAIGGNLPRQQLGFGLHRAGSQRSPAGIIRRRAVESASGRCIAWWFLLIHLAGDIPEIPFNMYIYIYVYIIRHTSI